MIKFIVSSLVLFIVSMQVMADTPTFDFVELGFTSIKIDSQKKNFNGVDLRGNYSLGENFYIGGDYFRADLDGSPQKVEITTLGVGYRVNISNSALFFIEVDGTIIDPKGPDNHENGIEVSAGVRNNFSDNIELKAAIEVFDTETYKMTTLVLGGAYKLGKSYSIYSDIKAESDSTRWTIGARYAF